MKRGRKLKKVFLHYILHADDTPHRIALGAAVGMFIAWTPTIGIQMVLAVAIATLLRANKAVTIPMVWISNPLTNVPIYAFAYAFGNFLLTGTWRTDPQITGRIVELMKETMSLSLICQSAYWSNLFDLLMKVSGDLWIGSIVLGLLTGIITYPLTYRLLVNYRKVKKVILARHSNSEKSENSEPKASHPEDQHHAA
jgi:hypothetical protein